MRKILYYNNYKKDLKLVKKQSTSKGWDLNEIDNAVSHLQNSDILPQELLDHPLIGKCIVYQRNDKELHLRRIGRHQDIFTNY